MIGRCDNLHHLIYIDDLIEGLLLAADKEEAVGTTFVLAGAEPLTTLEMVAGVARQLGVSPPRMRMPMAPVMFAARATEAMLRPLGIQPPLHPRRMNFFLKSFSFSMSEAFVALAFAPRVSFAEGVAATARWYAEEGILEDGGQSRNQQPAT